MIKYINACVMRLRKKAYIVVQLEQATVLMQRIAARVWNIGAVLSGGIDLKIATSLVTSVVQWERLLKKAPAPAPSQEGFESLPHVAYQLSTTSRGVLIEFQSTVVVTFPDDPCNPRGDWQRLPITRDTSKSDTDILAALSLYQLWERSPKGTLIQGSLA